MHVELGALSELHLEVSRGDLVHELSPADVNNASGLARYGYQQLRPILEPGRTLFDITLPYDKHKAVAVIQVLTVVHQESGHSKADVVGAYQPCCSQVLDERIRSDIALVYNSYIRANRQTFDDACPGQHPSPQTLGIPRRDEIHYGDDNDDDRESTSNENSNITDLPPEKETEKEVEGTSKKNDEIVKLLVRQVKVGMKKMTKRKEAFDPLTIDASYFLGQSEEIRALFESIFAKIKQIQAQNLQRERGATEDVCGLAKLFENGEDRGKTNERKAHVWKMWRWWFWYFHSCLRIIFFNWRQMERDRKANGAYVMHLIVNDLLATEGISALAVIAALAEQTHYLYQATHLSSKRQLEISMAVAKSLRGKLTPPPQDYLIPMVVGWVSAVTKLRAVYHDLGCPNLALLQLDMVGRPEDGLKFSREYSFLSDKLKPFASMQEQLSRTIQMRHLDMWVSASEIQRFSMVVEEWWNQPPLSHHSQSRSLNDPEANFFIRSPSESSERTRNGSEESENEETSPPLTASFDSTEARAIINARVQSATMTPDPHVGRVDETDEIDKILAAAALQGMQRPTTILDSSQNSFARPSTESAGRWPALGNVSPGHQITFGSGEISGLSHAMNLTGTFGSPWIPGPWDQDQSQSENNLRRRYVPDASSEGMEPPHKHSRLDHQINPDAAVPTQNYEDQTAIMTSVPTTMRPLQHNEGLGAETRQEVDPWDSLRDPSIWFDLDALPLTPAGHTDLWVPGLPQPVNNDPPSFSNS
ncbi:hypothetical protein LTR72_011271 [Exophiala xenobiotica]|nr:hypothetical protein LTR92_010803 [Exophiala xenobiotica]KAK5215686.1 hypothetical protein LTR72_011271 [Exophiala xenobiotica]KAK5284994.1 hypothetical protein LTR14_011325 [Exophiala xenobiotica]